MTLTRGCQVTRNRIRSGGAGIADDALNALVNVALSQRRSAATVRDSGWPMTHFLSNPAEISGSADGKRG